MKRFLLSGGLLMAAAAVPVPLAAQGNVTSDNAALFGAQEVAYSAALSPDGKRLVFVAPSTGASTVAMVAELAADTSKVIAQTDGNPMRLGNCDWSAADRLVCSVVGMTDVNGVPVSVLRLIAADADGTNALSLGQRNSGNLVSLRQFDGEIVDWLDGKGGNVLMSRFHVTESGAGRRQARSDSGMSLDLVDTRTGKATTVERADEAVTGYTSDGLGHARIRTTRDASNTGMLRGVERHYYRKAGEKEWLPLGTERVNGETLIPLAVDPTRNAAYVLEPLDGKRALYRIALDGSLKKELVFSSREVDVGGVVRVGRGGRVIGFTYTTDRTNVQYFDPAYRDIAADLVTALPKLPILYFMSASADEQLLLIRASSDVEPGNYYLLDRGKKTLQIILQSRPSLRGKTLSPMKPIEYAASDGTRIPGYLTLPPGVTDARNLPAIVMPHGGPAARDVWGFSWMAQFYAQQGFAVLQPNFRGSAGYGERWFVENGFKGWKLAIGDISDGARWLIAQGIANPQQLAAVGWSYGGYAALQANVLDAYLFKAVIAIAPVTDLDLLREQYRSYTNFDLISDYIGSGPHIEEGSPAANAAAFKAPVLMFHGDLDRNVEIQQSRRMDRALRGAGKSTELIVYPGLEHSLRDGTARADMLRRSEAFLRQHLKMQPPSP